MTDENENELELEEVGDVADLDELHDMPAEPPSVAVHASRPVPTVATGLRVGSMQNHLVVAGENARKILGHDPRRARVTLWLSTLSGASAGIVFAMTEGEAQARRGAILPVATVPVRLDLEAVSELWVRTADDATNVTLNIVAEYWSR